MDTEPTAQRVSNRLIVKLDRERYVLDEDLDREANAIAADIAGAEVERVSHSGRVLLNLSAEVDAASLAEALSTRDGVVYAEPDVIDRAQDPDC